MSRSHLLRGLLERQFPEISFNYLRFNKVYFGTKNKIDLNLRKSCLGVIAELKQLKTSSLSYYDNLIRQFSKSPLIFVLSPESFKLLSTHRKKSLFENMIIISELKSLDYLTQLPRLMEEVSLRHRLRKENEKLRKMIEMENGFDQSLNSALESKPKSQTQKGLKITLTRWNLIKNRLGNAAQRELIDAFSRMISRAVRASDRVLHNRDNEFIVFLSNVEGSAQKQCMQRVREKLSSIDLAENSKPVSLSFKVQSVSQLPPTS